VRLAALQAHLTTRTRPRADARLSRAWRAHARSRFRLAVLVHVGGRVVGTWRQLESRFFFFRIFLRQATENIQFADFTLCPVRAGRPTQHFRSAYTLDNGVTLTAAQFVCLSDAGGPPVAAHNAMGAIGAHARFDRTTANHQEKHRNRTEGARYRRPRRHRESLDVILPPGKAALHRAFFFKVLPFEVLPF